MSFRQGGIEFNGLYRCQGGLIAHLRGRSTGEHLAEKRLRKAGVSGGITRIDRDGLLKIANSTGKIFGRALIGEVETAQVGFVSLGFDLAGSERCRTV